MYTLPDWAMSVFFSNSNLNILDLLLKEYLSLVPGTDMGYGLLRMSMAEVTGAPWVRLNILLDSFKNKNFWCCWNPQSSLSLVSMQPFTLAIKTKHSSCLWCPEYPQVAGVPVAPGEADNESLSSMMFLTTVNTCVCPPAPSPTHTPECPSAPASRSQEHRSRTQSETRK